MERFGTDIGVEVRISSSDACAGGSEERGRSHAEDGPLNSRQSLGLLN